MAIPGSDFMAIPPGSLLAACLKCGLTIMDDWEVIELHGQFHAWLDSVDEWRKESRGEMQNEWHSRMA